MSKWFSESLQALLALIESTLRFVGTLLAPKGREHDATLRHRRVGRRLEEQLQSGEAVVRALRQFGRAGEHGRPSLAQQDLPTIEKGDEHGRGD